MTKFSEITASHALVKQVRSLQQKKFRDETGLFVAEGEKCVSELMKGFEPVYLFREGENATSVQIAQMSSLRTPQGVIAVFRQRSIPNPQSPITTPQSPITNLTLALDGVQDPGNLGTIIRTCDWFGVHDIFCSLDTADCYNPKVVQATMGALARVRIHYVDLPAWLQSLTNPQSPTTNHQSPTTNPQSPMIFGTLLEGRNMYEVLSPTTNPQSPISNPQFSIIIMGNEGNGISSAVRPLVTHPIRIPSFPQDAETSESLNVSIATAIVLAEFRRREL